MKRKLWLDIDGVMRDLSLVLPVYPRTWIEKINGETFMEYFDNRLDLLFDAPQTEYFPIICEFVKKKECANIITCQPDNWKPYTLRWLDFNFGLYDIKEYFIRYVDRIDDKVFYIKDNEILLEDYPFFPKSMKDKTILIDRPYNQNTKNYIVRVKTPQQLRNILQLLC